MLSKRIDKVRDAYLRKDVDATIKAHEEGHALSGQGMYLKSLVYGGLDGIITTFAVVAGVAGASLQPAIVLILGFANLLGDGFSMATGDYLSTKAEREYAAAERKREEWEVDVHPKGEAQELIEIFRKKGFTKEQTSKLVAIYTKNKRAWVDTMMVDELGFLEQEDNPLKSAMVTFFSFLGFGCIPLLAYVANIWFPLQNTFLVAIVLTALTLFLLGTVKTRFTRRSLFKAGGETLLVGGIAALLAYGAGYLISTFI